MGELANCPRCNAVFMKGTAAICQTCVKKEEQDFQTVYGFLRKKSNRTASVNEMEAKTGVPEKQIRAFVKQKRLHPSLFPSLDYGCEKCGAPIQEGRICGSCTEEFGQNLKQLERNQQFADRIKGQEKPKAKTYYSSEYDSFE
ncbi:TIGR03826 family flagellar region protein [Halobacillus litoralis]|uniref:TIGR03826 family flagellar region protein n=1 Tax=Halobacillus litoralis TaxID=45668 RepID=UPI001CD7C478|nr:TIGR03826 family flagellar region protein [Halobacillus litoralis]MCA1021253.1 flagellar protein YvyF [Halobacillus litoralis]